MGISVFQSQIENQTLSEKVGLGASDSRASYTKIFFGRVAKAEMGVSFSLHLQNVERVYHRFMHMSSCSDALLYTAGLRSFRPAGEFTCHGGLRGRDRGCLRRRIPDRRRWAGRERGW